MVDRNGKEGEQAKRDHHVSFAVCFGVVATMAMMADQDNAARDVAEQLGVSLSTLYTYVDGRDRPEPRGRALAFGF